MLVQVGQREEDVSRVEACVVRGQHAHATIATIAAVQEIVELTTLLQYGVGGGFIAVHGPVSAGYRAVQCAAVHGTLPVSILFLTEPPTHPLLCLGTQQPHIFPAFLFPSLPSLTVLR